MRLADLSGRSVAVWGSGPAGRAALRAIVAHAPSRLIAVDDTAGYLAVPWDDEPAPLAGGDHAFPALVTAEVVVRSPEVPPAHPWLTELHDRGVVVTTGDALWMADHAAQAVVVTGGESRGLTAELITHLLAALDRPAAHGGGAGSPLLGLPAAQEYVAELAPAQCAGLPRPPRVAVVTTLPEPREVPDPLRGGPETIVVDGPVREVLDLLRAGPEMIVVDGTDLRLRDAIRGITDLNGFPPIPAAAEDSRFRIEDDQVFCSDEPMFPRDTLRLATDGDGRALCVALAVLDGLGIDVPGTRDDLRVAVAAFGPSHATAPQ